MGMSHSDGVRLDHVVTSGTFSLDGETHDVDNNVWVIGNEEECVVIDAPHDTEKILDVVGSRKLAAILCTHAHDDHVRVAPELREATGAPILLHPDEKPLWELTHPDLLWDVDLSDDQDLHVGGIKLTVIHTPGTPRARSASSPPTWVPSSPGTRCSRAVPGRPGGRSATPTSSRSRSGRGCSRCPTTPSCTPGTVTTPRSARRPRHWAADPVGPAQAKPSSRRSASSCWPSSGGARCSSRPPENVWSSSRSAEPGSCTVPCTGCSTSMSSPCESVCSQR